MFRPTMIAGLVALGLAAGAAAAGPETIGLAELLGRLPLLFERAVVVRGALEAWGDIAALADGQGREVMVDLRTLDPQLRAALNRDCPGGRPCSVAVEGTIRHIRGPQISELGLEASAVDVQ